MPVKTTSRLNDQASAVRNAAVRRPAHDRGPVSRV